MTVARVEVVHALAAVLLQLHSVHSHGAHSASDDDRVRLLCDLIALRHVRVEVVLALESTPWLREGAEAESGADAVQHALAVDSVGQHTGQSGVDGGCLAIGSGPEGGRGAGEELGGGEQLTVNLQPDDQLVARCRRMSGGWNVACFADRVQRLFVRSIKICANTISHGVKQASPITAAWLVSQSHTSTVRNETQLRAC